MNHSTLPLIFHTGARTRFGQTPFIDPLIAQQTWKLILQHFPDAYAAVLMPNHFHIITPSMQHTEVLDSVTSILKWLSIRHRLGQKFWDPISAPKLIPDALHLRRQIRYVHLNPCRKALIRCPLEWKYSTHRHYLGYCFKPWRGTQEILKQEFGAGFINVDARLKFHRYVSSDPSCNVQGTPLPTAAQPEKLSSFSIQDIQQAVLALTPLSNAVKRKLLLWLMEDQGFHDREVQSQVMGVGYRRIQQLRHRPGPKPHTLQLLRTFLNDTRLINNVGVGINFVKSEISPL